MQLNSHLVSQALGPAAAGNPASALAVNPAALANALAAAAPQQAPPQQAAAGLGLGLTSAALAAALAAASQGQASAGAQQAQAQAHAGVHAGAWGAAQMPRSVAPAREPEQMTPAAPTAGAAKKLSVLKMMPIVRRPLMSRSRRREQHMLLLQYSGLCCMDLQVSCVWGLIQVSLSTCILQGHQDVAALYSANNAEPLAWAADIRK